LGVQRTEEEEMKNVVSLITALLVIGCVDPSGYVPEVKIDVEASVSGYLDASNSGWLTIRNASANELADLWLQPKRIQDPRTPADEVQAIVAQRITIRAPVITVSEYPSNALRVPCGDWIIAVGEAQLTEVSVQPENATNYGGTNVVTVQDAPTEPPGGEPKVSEIQMYMLSFNSGLRIWSASSKSNPNVWSGLRIGDVLAPSGIFDGPGSIADRQEAASNAVYRHGAGIEMGFQDNGSHKWTVLSFTDCWFEIEVPALYNEGTAVVVRIEVAP
jgi:hypothetical protein